jgi:hypothetical protein
MKLIFYFLLVAIAFMFFSKLTIQWKPFKISFSDIANGFGWLFMLFSIICFRISGYNNGNIEGYREALKDVKKELLKKN